jgi:hypothetical protein
VIDRELKTCGRVVWRCGPSVEPPNDESIPGVHGAPNMDKYMCLSPVYSAAVSSGHSVRVGLWFDRCARAKGRSTVEVYATVLPFTFATQLTSFAGLRTVQGRWFNRPIAYPRASEC